jgi:nicotinamidase-related amidase
LKSFALNTGLVVVDVQRAFADATWGKRNNPAAERNIAELIASWRATSRPLIHIQHRSSSPEGLFRPGLPGFEFKPEAQPLPGEQVFQKSVNSAFIGTQLEEYLRRRGIDRLVIVGITTDHCVSTTARMAGNLGFDTYVVSDATATFERRGPGGLYFTAQQMHDTALTSLSNEFATVLESAAVLERIA